MQSLVHSTAKAGYGDRSWFFVNYYFSDSNLRVYYSKTTKLLSSISKFASPAGRKDIQWLAKEEQQSNEIKDFLTKSRIESADAIVQREKQMLKKGHGPLGTEGIFNTIAVLFMKPPPGYTASQGAL
jgi:hypothetical protein